MSKRFVHMPRYKSGHRPDLDGLIAEKARIGGIFSTKEAEERGISRQMLSYYKKQGRIKRLRYGVYKSALFPSDPNEYIIEASTAVPGTAVAGPSALALQQIGHLESQNVWLRPIAGTSVSLHHTGTAIVEPAASPDELIDLGGGLKAENAASAINSTSQIGFYDEDQIEEVRKEAKEMGLI